MLAQRGLGKLHSVGLPQRPRNRHRPAPPLAAAHQRVAIARILGQEGVRRRIIRLPHIAERSRSGTEQHHELQREFRRRRVKVHNPGDLRRQHRGHLLGRLLQQEAVPDHPCRMQDPRHPAIRLAKIRDQLPHRRRIRHVEPAVPPPRPRPPQRRQLRPPVLIQFRAAGQNDYRVLRAPGNRGRKDQPETTRPARDQVHPAIPPRHVDSIRMRQLAPRRNLILFANKANLALVRPARACTESPNRIRSAHSCSKPHHLPNQLRVLLARRLQ